MLEWPRASVPSLYYLGSPLGDFSWLFLPGAMAFAAGGMLFVISDEIISETSRKGIQQEGTLGILLGFVVMVFLEIAWG